MDTKTLLSSLATEQVNARSERLDQMSALEIVTLMNDVTADVTAGVSRALPALAEAVDAIVARMKKGGRLIYMGAGLVVYALGTRQQLTLPACLMDGCMGVAAGGLMGMLRASRPANTAKV